MIRDLRKKFVIVTTLLLVTVISILMISVYLYSNYWSEFDMYQLVKWVSDSGAFSSDTPDTDSSSFSDMDEDDTVVGVIIDSTGNIVSTQTIGGTYKDNVSNELVQGILQKGKDEWKFNSIIYSIKDLSGGRKLIVFVNMDNTPKSILRIAGYILIILAALGVLIMISFMLSGFVTVPAQKGLEREKQFIADAGHELKTPLGAISINAQALEMKEGSSIHVKNILSETERMNHLVERLLTLSRLEDTGTLKKNRFSASAATEEIILTYESVAYEKTIKYDYSIFPDIDIIGDVEEYKQLVAILLDNAIKHTDCNGSILIELNKKGQKTQLSVKNTGKGISERDMPHVFERFYSSEHSVTKGSFGLGLSIAKAIVQRLDGEITAQNCSDGVIFNVLINQ